MICETCKAKIPTLATRLRRVNSKLYQLGLTYHQSVPFEQIHCALSNHGFGPLTDEAGNATSLHANVGGKSWIHITWHRMSSGKYEVVAYVN